MDHHFLQLLACFSSLLSSCLKVSLLCFAIHHFCKARLASFCFSIGKDVLSPSSHYPLALFDGGETEDNLRANLTPVLRALTDLKKKEFVEHPCQHGVSVPVYIVFYSGDMCYIWNMNGNFHGDVCPSCNVAPEHLASRQAFDSSRPRPFGEKYPSIFPRDLFSPSCYVPDCLHDLLRDGAQFLSCASNLSKTSVSQAAFNSLRQSWTAVMHSAGIPSFRFSKAEGEHHYSITGITGAIKYKLFIRQLLDLADFKRMFSSESIAKKVFFAYSHLCRCLQLIHFWKPQESLIEELKKECELERKAWLSAFGNDRFTPHLHQTVFEDPKAMEKYGNILPFSQYPVERKNKDLKRSFFDASFKDKKCLREMLLHEYRLIANPFSYHSFFPCDLDGFRARTQRGLNIHYALVHPESIRGKQVLAQMAVNREKKAAAKQRKEAKQKEQEEAKQQDEDPDSLDENDDSDEENEDGLNQEFVNSPPAAAVAADNSSPEMNVEQ